MYKFGVFPYLNASPLVHFIPNICPGAELIRCFPCDTASELLSGNVDAALIPVADFFDIPDLRMVEGLGICANGNVESVLLQCHKPLKYVRTIAFDPASKTSNLLLKVLVRQHFNLSHNIIWNNPLQSADAHVIIGDHALCAAKSFESYDLAGQWKRMTGLPFVFAVWSYRRDHPDGSKISQLLGTAKQSGCSAIDRLGEIYASKLGITKKRCRQYLTNCIHYDIGTQELAGMELFRNLSQNLKKEARIPIHEINNPRLRNVTDVKPEHHYGQR